jgi:hypothetical protein
MSRRSQGKLRPLTRSERAARKARNERRGRIPRERRWERDHIVKTTVDRVQPSVRTRSKASLLREAMRERFFQETRDRIKANEEKKASKE